MSSPWYREVPADAPLTQGDLIDSCPLVEWDAATVTDVESLKAATRAVEADVIVMTQACDLEHGKLQNVLLCPRDKLGDHRELWAEDQRRRKQEPSSKSWRRYCQNIRDGFVWNLGLLDAIPNSEPVVVDFHEVYTVPRVFLDSFLQRQNRPRLRLASPYREHLSQAFARFFMRVGLPSPVKEAW